MVRSSHPSSILPFDCFSQAIRRESIKIQNGMNGPGNAQTQALRETQGERELKNPFMLSQVDSGRRRLETGPENAGRPELKFYILRP